MTQVNIGTGIGDDGEEMFYIIMGKSSILKIKQHIIREKIIGKYGDYNHFLSIGFNKIVNDELRHEELFKVLKIDEEHIKPICNNETTLENLCRSLCLLGLSTSSNSTENQKLLVKLVFKEYLGPTDYQHPSPRSSTRSDKDDCSKVSCTRRFANVAYDLLPGFAKNAIGRCVSCKGEHPDFKANPFKIDFLH